jgi:hypothetical protein
LCSARVSWFTRAYCPSGSLAWTTDQAGPAGSSPAHTGWVGPSPQKIKKMEPACPTCVTKGMFGKNTPLYLGHNFYAHSSWYLAKQALFWYQKILKIFGDLRCFICDPLTLCFIFFFVFCIFLVICSIYGPTLLNTKFVVQCLYYFHLIRANDNKC